MSIAPLIAASLLVVLAVAHSALGERYILIRLFRRPDLPRLFGSDLFTRGSLRLAWHVTSVAWLGVAVLLLQASRSGSYLPQAGPTLAVAFAVCAVMALVLTRGRHLSWIAFAVIAACAWNATSH